MVKKKKKSKVEVKLAELSNPYSAGSGGAFFESHVQSAFVVLMLTGGTIPCLPAIPIEKIKLQGKYAGYNTDDFIVFLKDESGRTAKLLAQIKHSIKIIANDKTFGEVIMAAWADFNNSAIFNPRTDNIALITGPLSSTDTANVCTLLEWARVAESAADFLRKVELEKVSSKAKQEKMLVFRDHLKHANNKVDVSDDDLWLFMKSFHLLGFDLDIKSGVSLSLVKSIIGRQAQEDATAVWLKVVNEVQSANKNAGTIMRDKLSPELRELFEARPTQTMPVIAPPVVPPAVQPFDWGNSSYADALAVAGLLGSWSEQNESDKRIVERVTDDPYSEWIKKIRQALPLPQSPLRLKDGVWKFKDDQRIATWTNLGSRLFDDQIERFKSASIEVLSESDPRFELDAEQWSYASLLGKDPTYSKHLKEGLSEGLALLGSCPEPLGSLSTGHANSQSILAVRGILQEGDWRRWASVQQYLPPLAEAAPVEFLNLVEVALVADPSPFVEVFAQEGGGLMGNTYITGLLWALESLAWDEDYLVRVSIILAKLAAIDPGGRYMNRPSNSLADIFLPWLPQTCAPAEKRIVAINTIVAENVGVAWKLLLELLPNQRPSSSGTRKPNYRKYIPEERDDRGSGRDYWEQTNAYAEMALALAKDDLRKLVVLTDRVEHLPPPTRGRLFDYLGSAPILGLSPSDKKPLWNNLCRTLSHHRSCPEAQWVLDETTLQKIQSVAKALEPESVFDRSQRLFNDCDELLFNEELDYQEQHNLADEMRKEAIASLLDEGGLERVLDFSKTVTNSRQVGFILGKVDRAALDSSILPALLDSSDDVVQRCVDGYVCEKFAENKWSWIESLGITAWSKDQQAKILSLLPFTNEVWGKVADILPDDQKLYWSVAWVNPYVAEGCLEEAVDKLLEHGRGADALRCLYQMKDKGGFPPEKGVEAIQAMVKKPGDLPVMGQYQLVEVIQYLQSNPKTDQVALRLIEWNLLPFLDGHRGESPITLERAISEESAFFCEIIRAVYRSKNEESPKGDVSEEKKQIAENAHRLLRKWSIPPGMQSDGTFDGGKLNAWLVAVRKECTETGHLDVAMICFGHVLIHVPSDPEGLWIDKAVANILNNENADKIRRGYCTAKYNSRGCHTVDPTGASERKLAVSFREKADAVENEGFHRFAITLRELADGYDREAERVIADERLGGLNDL